MASAKRVSLFPILLVNFIGTLGFSIVLPFLVTLVTRFGGNALVYGAMGATYSAFHLVGAPILETRACHYESSVDRNFIVDRHPDFGNVWLAGGGSAEAFKFGPVLGEYIAKRVLGLEDDPELADNFRLKDEEFETEEDEGRDRGG